MTHNQIRTAMDEMLEFNERFVKKKDYEKYRADKLPDKQLAVLSCMDTRLTELLPAALDFRNGDIKLIKNAGGIISHPFGSAMRSLLVSVYFMDVREIAVISHYDCGMQGFDPAVFRLKLEERGVTGERIQAVEDAGIDLGRWLKGFDDPKESVRATVETIRNHPFMPKDVLVRGFLIDPGNGRVDEVVVR